MKRRVIGSIFLLLFAGTVCRAADIMWVSFHDTDAASADASAAGLTDAADIGYTNLLSSNGHNVTRFLTREPLTSADIDQLNASDLVIVSRSVNSGQYDPPTDWNTNVTAPMIAMSGYILRSSRLNLTDGTTMVDTTEPLTLTAEDPSHPIFNGITIGADNAVAAMANVVTVNGALQRGVSINNSNIVGGSLIASSTEAATMGGPVVAEWPAGATLNNGEMLAGPRMSFMSGSREADGVSSQTAGLFDLTPVGETMFLNAVEYMTVPEPSSNSLVAAFGLVVLAATRRRRYR